MFDYLLIFVSIIYGLAAAYVLEGVTKIIKDTGKGQAYWIHFLWIFNMLLILVMIWWTLYYYNRIEEWDLGLFLFITVYSLPFYVLAALLIPTEINENTNFEAHYFKIKGWFFGVLTMAHVLDMIDTAIKTTVIGREFDLSYAFVISALTVFSFTAIFTKNKKFHAFYAILYPLMMGIQIAASLGTVVN